MEARIIFLAIFALLIKLGSCDFSHDTTAKNTEPEGPVVSPLCPPEEDPKHPTVLPHPDDCSKFYKCLYGKAYPIDCPKGLHWSTKLQRCDWPEVAECDPSIPTTKIPDGTSPPATDLPPTSVEPTEAPKKDPRCPTDEDPKTPTVLPHPSDCSKFYKCLNGFAHPVSCPQGLHWSSTLNRCDWPEVAKCDQKGQEPSSNDQKTPLNKEILTTVMPTTTAIPTSVTPPIHEGCPATDDPQKQILLPNPDDCSKFYKCVNKRGYPMACPTGLHFSTKLERCDWPEVAGCDSNIPTTALPRTTPSPKTPSTTPAPSVPLDCPANEDPKNPTVLPYPGDCSKFYKCLNGRAYPIACPDGLHYSPKLERCDWPEIAKCDPKIPAEPTARPEYPSTTPTITNAPSPSTQAPQNKLILPGNPSKAIKSCTGNNQLLAHETDCTKFIQCSGDLAVEKSCPMGTHFNSQLMICDYPESARCRVGVSEIDLPKQIIVENPSAPADVTIVPRQEVDQKNICEQTADNSYLQHPQDCSRYVHCYNKQMFIQQCPPGLLWNHQLNYCDYKEKVDCNN